MLDSTQALGSFLVIEQLVDLQHLLRPHSPSPAVADFLDCLEEALSERLRLYQWLTTDERDQPTHPWGRLVSPGDAPYERDPEAWNAYLAEGNAKQARKRVSADMLLRDGTGRLLLVDPKYKPDWDLPGGMAEANEPPAGAAHRELNEELGLDLQAGDLLCVDWVPPHARGMT